jgi:hypothetical protein
VVDKQDFTVFLFGGMLCWVLPFNELYHKIVLYVFEGLSLHEYTFQDSALSCEITTPALQIHTPAMLLLLFVEIM